MNAQSLMIELEFQRERANKLEIALGVSQQKQNELRLEIFELKKKIQNSENIKHQVNLYEKVHEQIQELQAQVNQQAATLDFLGCNFQVIQEEVEYGQNQFCREEVEELRSITTELLPEEFDVVTNEMLSKSFDYNVTRHEVSTVQEQPMVCSSENNLERLYDLKCKENQMLKKRIRLEDEEEGLSNNSLALPQLPLKELQDLQFKVAQLETRLKTISKEKINLSIIDIPEIKELIKDLEFHLKISGRIEI